MFTNVAIVLITRVVMTGVLLLTKSEIAPYAPQSFENAFTEENTRNFVSCNIKLMNLHFLKLYQANLWLVVIEFRSVLHYLIP